MRGTVGNNNDMRKPIWKSGQTEKCVRDAFWGNGKNFLCYHKMGGVFSQFFGSKIIKNTFPQPMGKFLSCTAEQEKSLFYPTEKCSPVLKLYASSMGDI